MVHRDPALQNLIVAAMFFLQLLAIPGAVSAATIYADGDPSGINDWIVFDNKPAGAEVASVYDTELRDNIVETTGAKTSNGYRLGGSRPTSSQRWNNSIEFFASWKLSADEYFVIFIDVDTERGWRRLRYTPSNSTTLLASNLRDIRHGLGSHTRDGLWRTFSRDLQADINAAEENNRIIAVNGFQIKGSVRLDDIVLADNLSPQVNIAPYQPVVYLGENMVLDGAGSIDPDGTIVSHAWVDANGIELCNEASCPIDTSVVGKQHLLYTITDNSGLSAIQPVSFSVTDASIATVYEDAEDGNTEGWLNSGSNRGEATISNILDDEAGSRVIQLQTASTRNSFLLGHYREDRGWDNQIQFVSRWQMKTSQNFKLSFYLETAQGRRQVRYDQSAVDRYSGRVQTGKVIRFGLGQESRNGNWQTYTRDLQADLAEFQPDNTLIAIQGLVFRGSASFDNISLLGDSLEPDPLPVASFTAVAGPEANSLSIQLDASESSDNDAITRYNWDFGNGESGQGVQTTVIYNTAGEKSISLTVTDSAGQSATQVQSVFVTDSTPDIPPVASFTVTPESSDGSYTLAFDASASSAAQPATVVSYAWEFGDDNTGEGLAVTHSFAQPGTYPVTLTITDSNNLANSVTESILVVTPDPAPVASFTAVAGSGANSLTLQLDASASTDNDPIVSYNWDFGNGETAEGVQTSVAYVTPGEKIIMLTVSDSDNQTSTVSQSITITDNTPTMAPSAAFTASPDSPFNSFVINFDASASSAEAPADIANYTWDFGDDTTGTGVTVIHNYQPGEYVVTLAVTDSNDLNATASQTITVVSPDPEPPAVSAAQAARLLTQASFGPTSESIANVQTLGIEGWIDDQIAQIGPPHLDYVNQYANNGSDRFTRHDIWWLDAVNGSDQLRQRVAFALSQIFVISDAGYNLGNSQYGVTHYYDLLRENAFGSFRELLEDISLSPIMGLYLSMLQNAKADLASKTLSDENYAREVMQLFTIGPHALHANGNTKVQTGLPVPSFSQHDVEELARVFTGWNYKGASRWDEPLGNGPNVIDPMEAFPDYHDSGGKVLLGDTVIPAGQSAREDLEKALDVLADHSNTAPFIVKQLIQKLVTSNPTPAYVARIGAVFNNNGNGVRGDLGAVVRALLLDPEARQDHVEVPGFGKLREPLLRLSHLWRAFDIRPGRWSNSGEYNTNSPHVQGLTSVTGQAALRASSVFNFYSPDYAPLGPVQNAGLVAPEAELYIDNLIATTTTRINTQIQRFYASTPFNSDLNQSTLNFEVENGLAADPPALLDHLDILLLSGAMSGELRGLLLNHLESFPETTAGHSKRVRDAVSLIMASPEYLVQR